MTYKPASVKMDAKMTCCRRVARRRQRSGIGYFVSDPCTLWDDDQEGAYQYEYYDIEEDIRNAFAYKESMEVDTRSVFHRI